MKMENFQKLLELKKDLTGIDNLTLPGRVRLFALNEKLCLMNMSLVLYFSYISALTVC